MKTIIMNLRKVSLKQILAVILSLSWVFHLSIMNEINNSLKRLNYGVLTMEDELEAVKNKITQNLGYSYMVLDEGDYESIFLYKVDNETGNFYKKSVWSYRWEMVD